MHRARDKGTARAARLLALAVLAAAGCAEGEAYWLSTMTTTTTTPSTTAASTTTAAPATTAAPTTTIPADALRVAADGSGEAPDLESALGMIAPGGTILLEAGVHTLGGPLAIETPVIIRGMGSELTTVIGEQAPELLRFTGPGPFALEGITFRYRGTGAADGLVAEGGTIAFTDVTVVGAVRADERGGSGFLAAGGTTGTIDRCTARDNRHHGFEFRDAADVAVIDSTASANGSSGFAWSGQARGSARGSDARTNGLSGFVVLNRARPALTGNRSEENGDNGFLFKGTSRATATGNTAEGNRWAGFRWVEQASGVTEGNTARGNADGFWVADEAAPTLLGNISRGHHNESGTGSGLVYSGTDGGAARHNKIYDNDWGIALGTDAAPGLEDNDVHDNTANRVAGVTFG
jgi:hypothetical protein